MTGMTPERLAGIRANLPTPDADLSRRERDAFDLLDEVERLRGGIEDIRDEAWESWLNRDWQHLDTVRNDCNDLLNPTEGETDERR